MKDDKKYQKTMEDYGETAYQLSFTGAFNNPVSTYFSVKAQNELMSIAIATHKKVIESCILDMAEIIVQMIEKEDNIAVMNEYLDLLKKNERFYMTSEQYKTEIVNSSSAREDRTRDMELQLDTAKMELAMLRNRLKLLVGVDRDMRLDVDENSVEKEINGFAPDGLNWERCWEASTDRYLLAQQVRLHDAGIMLAWAQYVPNISFVVNESAPRGQSQPTGAETDEFLHITFNFPLLDWGHRYRNAEQSRAKKRQSRLDEVIKRQEFRQDWFTASDRLNLSNARLKQREHAVQSAERRLKAVTVAFEQGLSPFPELSSAQQALLDSRLAAAAARMERKKSILAWMRLAQTFHHKYLGAAVTEGK
jgi:outer membrane protein TolC